MKDIFVGGTQASAAVAMSRGDAVRLVGGNFDELDAKDIEVRFGAELATDVAIVSSSELSMTVPPVMHAETTLSVKAGWKGFADLGPFNGTKGHACALRALAGRSSAVSIFSRNGARQEGSS